MNKREELIWVLSNCASVQSESVDGVWVCPTCPYAKPDGTPCESLHLLLEDVVMFLKAQES